VGKGAEQRADRRQLLVLVIPVINEAVCSLAVDAHGQLHPVNVPQNLLLICNTNCADSVAVMNY
jgi:hypothetical protein